MGNIKKTKVQTKHADEDHDNSSKSDEEESIKNVFTIIILESA